MTLHEVVIYHNDESRFMPYEDGQHLTAAVSHWADLPAHASPPDIADWALHVCNADLDQLEDERTRPNGEANFLLACVYRLLCLRSMSVGDVIHVTTGSDTWLACEPYGWRRIGPPPNIHGQPLTAERVYRHIHAQWSGR